MHAEGWYQSLVNSYRMWPKLTLNGGVTHPANMNCLRLRHCCCIHGTCILLGETDNHQRNKNIILGGDGPYGGKCCRMKE